MYCYWQQLLTTAFTVQVHAGTKTWVVQAGLYSTQQVGVGHGGGQLLLSQQSPAIALPAPISAVNKNNFFIRQSPFLILRLTILLF